MKPTRILLLLVALLAGGLAAYLATRSSAPSEPVVVEAEAAPSTQILVAATAIGVGQRLSAETVSWQPWPETALRPEYITIAAMPDAGTELVGTIARFEFFPGEPIRSEKLVRTEQGYLSAVLSEGKRGVSINVSAESGAGGFIVPNDRVDVVLTRSGTNGEVSETILENVKVLAIGKRLGETGASGAQADPETPAGQGFEGGTIATLELDPGQGETIINAQSIGRLSLALRSIVDFDKVASPDARANRQSQSVRVIRYGRDTSVTTGNGGRQPAVQGTPAPELVAPAAPTGTPIDPGLVQPQSEGELQ